MENEGLEPRDERGESNGVREAVSLKLPPLFVSGAWARAPAAALSLLSSLVRWFDASDCA